MKQIKLSNGKKRKKLRRLARNPTKLMNYPPAETKLHVHNDYVTTPTNPAAAAK